MGRSETTKTRTAGCSHHCSATGGCGRHFHGQTAFDLHLRRVNQRVNPQGAREYDLEHVVEDVGLQVWTETGECHLTSADLADVTIYQVVQSQQWLDHLASLGDATA